MASTLGTHSAGAGGSGAAQIGADTVGARSLANNWWAVALQGVAALLFGVITFLAPGVTAAALVLLFGAYALADGVLAVVTALRRRGTDPRWGTLLLVGVAGLVVGVLTFLNPGMTALVLLCTIAGWSAATGILRVVAAVRLRKVIRGEWLLALTGVLSLVFAALLFAVPTAGALALALWVGAFAIAAGAVLLALALRLRAWHRGGAPARRTADPHV